MKNVCVCVCERERERERERNVMSITFFTTNPKFEVSSY